MKRLTTAISIAVLALPLCAQDKPSNTAAPTPQDSPLVAAAKASKRVTKKSAIVITNDNLVLVGGGHMSSTDTDETIPASAQATTNEGTIQSSKAAADSKARRDALAAKVEQMKKDPLGYMRSYEPANEATRMPTTQLPTTTTAQVPTATTAQPPMTSTSAVSTIPTAQPGTATTSQPEVAHTAQPPER